MCRLVSQAPVLLTMTALINALNNLDLSGHQSKFAYIYELVLLGKLHVPLF